MIRLIAEINRFKEENYKKPRIENAKIQEVWSITFIQRYSTDDRNWKQCLIARIKSTNC